MARPTKENTSFSMKIATPVYKRFRAYAEKLGQSYTVCLERIITEHLDEKCFHPEEPKQTDN